MNKTDLEQIGALIEQKLEQKLEEKLEPVNKKLDGITEHLADLSER